VLNARIGIPVERLRLRRARLGEGAKGVKGSGDGPKFLKFLKMELIPLWG